MEPENDEPISALLRDLGIKKFSFGTDLKSDFAPVFDLPAQNLEKIGRDVMALTGISGDWVTSLEVAEILLSNPKITETAWAETKVWHLRCLVELDRMSEAIAMAQSIKFPPHLLIFANYLSGIAYENLEMTEQAQQKFKAVYSQNPRFRDIANRLQE